MTKTYMRITFLIGLCALTLLSCQEEVIRPDEAFRSELFKEQPIRFVPDIYKNTYVIDDNSIGFAENGRVILKRIRIPEMSGYVAQLTIKLRSAGDPWDKAGSCFIVPVDGLTIDAVLRGNAFPEAVNDLTKELPGVVPSGEYMPAVELMRFMTPFGVGAFSDNEKNPPPAFVDGWAEHVEWKRDITAVLAASSREVLIGIWIDTWTAKGYIVDAWIDFSPAVQRKTKGITHIQPLLNTVFYSTKQKYPDIFAHSAVEAEAHIPDNAKNIRLVYTATGHGGHSYGDEFVQKKHIISLDGKEFFSFIPWRTDCATFRRYNPSSGVWLVKQNMRYYKDGKAVTEEVQVPLASSDMSRSNWCPGSQVEPEVIALNAITSGNHTFSFAIPEAQAIDGDKMNFWLVSAYVMWEE